MSGIWTAAIAVSHLFQRLSTATMAGCSDSDEAIAEPRNL